MEALVHRVEELAKSVHEIKADITPDWVTVQPSGLGGLIGLSSDDKGNSYVGSKARKETTS